MKYNKLFDFLSIVHFFWFYLLGLFLKNNYLTAFAIGVLWEVFEYYITVKNEITRNLLINYWPVPQRIWDEEAFNKNRFSDLIFNMLGYHFGNKSKYLFVF